MNQALPVFRRALKNALGRAFFHWKLQAQLRAAACKYQKLLSFTKALKLKGQISAISNSIEIHSVRPVLPRPPANSKPAQTTSATSLFSKLQSNLKERAHDSPWLARPAREAVAVVSSASVVGLRPFSSSPNVLTN